MAPAPGGGDASGAADAVSGPGRKRGGPPILFAVLGIGSLLLAVALIAAQALGIGLGPGPAPTMGPTGPASQLTHDLVRQALEKGSLQVQEPLTEYRPGENRALYLVPRRLLQVVLPDEPQGGYVVIYELSTNGEADQIGREFAAYLASGTGAVQYPAETRFVIRRLGPTLIFFAWSPAADLDERVPVMASILETVGVPLTTGGS